MPYSRKKFELSPRLKLGVGRGYSQNKILKAGSIICLFLALILTVNALRVIFSGPGSKNSTASSVNGQVLGASDTKVQDNNTAQFTEYKVQKGDTLFNLSQKYNIDWATLATLNNLKSPFALKPGQIVKIPK